MIRNGATTKKMVKLPKDPAACWGWLGAKNEKGVAIKCVGGSRTAPARRWMWEMLFGPIAKGMVVVQECGTADCVNPHHLRLGTYAAALREGRQAKLVAADAVAIRRERAEHIEAAKMANKRPRLADLKKKIAADYDVDVRTISDIWTGTTWSKQTKHPFARSHSEAQA